MCTEQLGPGSLKVTLREGALSANCQIAPSHSRLQFAGRCKVPKGDVDMADKVKKQIKSTQI
jgi:hypothetical protein